jgi:hypothetical protein
VGLLLVLVLCRVHVSHRSQGHRREDRTFLTSRLLHPAVN